MSGGAVKTDWFPRWLKCPLGMYLASSWVVCGGGLSHAVPCCPTQSDDLWSNYRSTSQAGTTGKCLADVENNAKEEEVKRPKTLSATFVRTIHQPGRYGDGRGGHGLSLLVKPTKIEGRLSKSWAQKIQTNGKYTNVGLGSYPAVNLAEARRRALRNRQAIEEGRNPRARKVPTFCQATEQVIRLHAAQVETGRQVPRALAVEPSNLRLCALR